MQQLLVLLFSAFFWIFGTIWILFSVIIIRAALLTLPFPVVFERVARPLLRVMILLATGGKLKVEYDPEFDPDVPSVYCFNHTNILDGLLSACVIPRAYSGVMESWQLNIPIYGYLMKWSGGIPIDNKEHPRKIIRQLSDEARLRRERGLSILVFPEAHRTLDGKIRSFEFGVFKMARDAGYPLVPVAVRGMFAVKRKGSYLFKPGPVHVRVGAQVDSRCENSAALRERGDQIRQFMITFVEGSQPENL